ncbi:ArsR family transcriptional regulator [Actinopolymorpha sp. B9G3]|uniref:ArsR/SmtB family transcription factor n=1 Tax=Actinopolymorpha sp. B9G3 TaxID=3158970 RepID=UPI0032D8B783
MVFTPDDMGRVRVTEDLDPMWEIVLSLHQMGARHTRASPYREWAGWVRTVARGRLAPVVAGLYELAPPQRYFPDFLTPAPTSTNLEAGIDEVLHVPRARLRSEMAKANGVSSRSSWLAGVAAGEPRQLRWLGSALRTYHDLALAQFHDQIATQLDDHRRGITRRMLSGGVHALLGSLARGIRWTPPVLTADYPADLTIDLGGRGLTLVPSFFCRGTPVTLANAELDPVLVYPIGPPPHWMQPTDIRDGTDRHLAALIGGPRAALLRALTSPLGTTRLAARTGLSLSSTSEHTAILRNSGLVRSTRSGRYVVHSLTPLGQRMLAGGH